MKQMTPRRRKIAALIIIMMSLSLCQPAYAGGPVEKLGRGIQNILFSPKEFLNTYDHTSEDRSFLEAATMTLFYGTAFTVTRIVVGAYEVVTFPIPLPQGYEPVMDPATP